MNSIIHLLVILLIVCIVIEATIKLIPLQGKVAIIARAVEGVIAVVLLGKILILLLASV